MHSNAEFILPGGEEFTESYEELLCHLIEGYEQELNEDKREELLRQFHKKMKHRRRQSSASGLRDYSTEDLRPSYSGHRRGSSASGRHRSYSIRKHGLEQNGLPHAAMTGGSRRAAETSSASSTRRMSVGASETFRYSFNLIILILRLSISYIP